MFHDTIDKILWALLAITLVTLAALLVLKNPQRSGAGTGGSIDKAVEREISYQARVALLQKLYGPVEQLRKEGQLQAALLKLDELGRSYPGEAHGSILQGEILLESGAFDEAVASFVRGVKLNGDYVDAKSPLSRRDHIERLVDRGMGSLKERISASPSNSSLATVQKNLFYLQSRLAGGCE